MFKSFSIVFMTALLVLIASCSSSTNNPVDNTTNGTSSVVTNKGTFNYSYGFGHYNTEDNLSTIAMGKSITDYSGNACVINVKGKSTGNFTLNDDNTIEIIINNVVYYSLSSTGSITITKYGDVGQQIIGTFTGKFDAVNTNDAITVNSASFSVTRLADVTDDDDDPFDDDDELDQGSLFADIDFDGIGNQKFDYKNMSTSAILNEMEDHFRIDFVLGSELDDDEMYADIIVISTLKTKTKQAGIPLKLTDKSSISDDSSIIIEIKGTVYYIDGTAVINKFAQNTDEYFEISANGKLILLADRTQAGTVKNLKIKIYRAM